MINLKLKQSINNYVPAMTAFRRELHKYPEPSWQEFETTKRIARELDALGVQYTLTDPTGLIAEIKGGKPGKTVALRADIDALSVTELNENIEYASTEKGKMHACGHDTHAAMLVTAAKALYGIKSELPGNVRLIFQPAEEVAEGALAMIKQGALEGVDNVFGQHIWTGAPTGKIFCQAGPCCAATDWLTIIFTGRGGHGSMPHECVDAVVVASSFVMNLQVIVSRESNPLDPAVITIGKLESGTRFNVIAETAFLEGTVRYFTMEDKARIPPAIKRYAEHTAAMYGATVEVDHLRGTLPVVNEERSAKMAQSVILETFGSDALYAVRPTTGGEDFCFYIEKVPGCIAFTGTANPEKGSNFAHHHGSFNVDEDSLAYGAELYAQYAWCYLNQNEF